MQCLQNPVKKSWPRCPSCKTSVESHETPPLEQEQSTPLQPVLVSAPAETPPQSVPSLEISTAPPLRVPDLLALPSTQEAPVGNAGWGESSPLQEAKRVALEAGFDKTCSNCKAPVRALCCPFAHRVLIDSPCSLACCSQP